MIELRSLGALDLRDGSGTELPSVLVHPKRTALLVYLAVATPRGLHRRDSLLALFWPERDSAHARGALRQMLHGLRQALGDDVLIVRGNDEVGLDTDRCGCDVLAFEEALDSGDTEHAIALYGGSFLRGFFLDGAPEFERWVEVERERLSRRYAEALDRVAQAAEARGDLPGAIGWWSRLAEHSPHSSRVASRLMRALEAAGDRAAAIRHAEQHAALMRADLDTEPDQAVMALAAQLRVQPSPYPSAPPILVAPGSSAPGSQIATVTAAPRFGPRVALVLAGLAVLGAGAWWAVNAAGIASGPLRRIAVLPLADQTGDSTQRYVVEGVHEMVTTELAQISGLSVKSRSSVMRYQGGAPLGREIARDLQVEAFVEGAVFLAGDSLRLMLQLIDARRDRHLWARTFEGKRRDVLSLSRTAAQAIARGARVALTPGEVARLSGVQPVNPEVSAAYLRARWHFNRNTQEGLERSVAFYRQAIALDSTFAPAYAGLADDYVIRHHQSGAPPDVIPQARALARRALELDEGQSDAYVVLGHIAFEYDWNWAEAERMLRRAIELNPSDARAHLIYGGGYLVAMSRFEDAEREVRLANELDPLSPAIAAAAAYPALYAGRYATAEPILLAAQQAFPDDQEILQALVMLHTLQGRYREAVAEMQGLPILGLRAWVYGQAGLGDSAVATLRRLQERARREPVPPMAFVDAYVGVGDRERALDYLEMAIQERSRRIAWLNEGLTFAPLRGHPRFQALVARMRFPG